MSDTKEERTAGGLLPRRRDLPVRPAGRDLLVREPEDGRVHFLNASAALIWECCDGETTLATCVQRLRSAFPIPAETDLDEDIRAAVADLSARGLLERGEGFSGA
ncbi:MAG: PqqD family protein [Armatimonadetes bacterium]|nr:PqqD family protein [Armatimonadota bacterium]